MDFPRAPHDKHKRKAAAASLNDGNYANDEHVTVKSLKRFKLGAAPLHYHFCLVTLATVNLSSFLSVSLPASLGRVTEHITVVCHEYVRAESRPRAINGVELAGRDTARQDQDGQDDVCHCAR